jgi:hypothetical protein
MRPKIAGASRTVARRMRNGGRFARLFSGGLLAGEASGDSVMAPVYHWIIDGDEQEEDVQRR